MNLLHILSCLFITGSVFFIDRITKIYALAHYLSIPYIVNKYFSLVTEFNQGSSLGILSGDSYFEKLFLLIGPLIPIFVLCIYYLKNNTFACSLIIAGGFSNLYDRIMYSGVIDFILFSIGNNSFPLFNIADISISLGVIILFYQLIYDL